MTPSEADDFPIDDAELLRRANGTGPRRLFGQDMAEFDRLADWSRRHPPAGLDTVEGFIVFVGYPRSGHSLVGALLDAHPEIAVAHELDVLNLRAGGFDRAQIVTLALENSARLARIGRQWGGYDYHVPGGWQGRWTRLRLVGDKRGGETSRRLWEQPEILDRFERFIGLPLRVIHVVRDPADNVATMVRHARLRADSARDDGTRLAQALSHYAALVRANVRFLDGAPAGRAVTLWHEDMVADPRRRLADLARFLGVAADDAYLDACAAVVQPSPRRSRDEVAWSPEHRAALDRIVASAPFLARYAATPPGGGA